MVSIRKREYALQVSVAAVAVLEMSFDLARAAPSSSMLSTMRSPTSCTSIIQQHAHVAVPVDLASR